MRHYRMVPVAVAFAKRTCAGLGSESVRVSVSDASPSSWSLVPAPRRFVPSGRARRSECGRLR